MKLSMTEKEKIETKKWAMGTVNDLSRGAVGFAAVDEIIKASDKIYDWVIDVKKK
jgi:hypothetical protein